MSSHALERLEFDPANPGDGPNMGVYLRAGNDGDQLTSTLTGGKEALDVNIAGSDISIDVDIDLDNLVADDEPDTEDPLKVGSRAHGQSSVLPAISASGDKANAISDLYRRIWVTSAPNVAWTATNGATDATEDTAAQADGTKPLGRQYVIFQNQGSKSIYIGPAGTVTTANGYEVAKGTSVHMELGQALNLFTVASEASVPYRLVQVA